jgi:hypothetical protein
MPTITVDAQERQAMANWLFSVSLSISGDKLLRRQVTTSSRRNEMSQRSGNKDREVGDARINVESEVVSKRQSDA